MAHTPDAQAIALKTADAVPLAAVHLEGPDPARPLAVVIGRISPIPLLIVHGDQDHYFPVEHPHALYAAARERIGCHLPRLVARGRRDGARDS